MKKELRVVDFFCGAGGFSEGFRQAGIKVVWAVDNWQPAVDTHSENHPGAETICDDVIRLSQLPDIAFHSIVPDSEIIIGSPPCTSFSNSNKSGKGDKSKGKELIKAYLRIIARKKYKQNSVLKYWILENVPKVQSYIKKRYSAKDLKLKGKFVLRVKYGSSAEYNAKYYGVPSNRIRYFCGEFIEPAKTVDETKLIPLKAILSDLGNPKTNLHKQIVDPLYSNVLNGEDVSDHHYIQQLSEFEQSKIIRLKQDRGYMGKMAVPENSEKPSRTIMATMSFTSRECFVLSHRRNKLRAPTIREVACLMSFPIDYRFYGKSLGTKYRMVGNAVPPKMAYAFAKAILLAEGLPVIRKYSTINHRHKIEFVNLNLNEISIKEEKRKKGTARFKYHIPYFKYDTYRVELTNYHSDFQALEFKWSAEIHYNQGKNKAKVFTPNLDRIKLSDVDTNKISRFLSSIKSEIRSFNEFQEIHCMTISEIRKRKLMGPYELLNLIKQFITESFDFRSNDYLLLDRPPLKIPKAIAIGYFILLRVTEQMEFNRLKQINKLKPFIADNRFSLIARKAI